MWRPFWQLAHFAAVEHFNNLCEKYWAAVGSANISHTLIPHPFHLLTRHVLILQPSITTLKPNKWVILITYLQVNKMCSQFCRQM